MFKIKGLFAGSSNWVKLLVTLLIPLFLLCLTSVIWALIIEAAGVDVTSLNVERAVQFISSVITFIVGGVFVAYLIFENPKEELMMSSWGGGKNYFYTKKSCFFVRDFKEISNSESSGCIEKNLFFMTKFTWNFGVFARAYGMTTCS